MMPWLHYTDFRGAHSPFNTVHKWAWGGLIEWVCGFLLTLQGPLQPTPARKQIKLQFHHLEGAVSCPNAALSLHPPAHIHTKLYTSASSEPLSSPAPKMPASFHCSIAERNGGIWGKKEGKRGMGGWEAKGIGSMHGDLIAASSQWNILLWRKRRERETDRLHCCGI